MSSDFSESVDKPAYKLIVCYSWDTALVFYLAGVLIHSLKNELRSTVKDE